MKKYLLTLIAVLLIGATTFAQTPQSFNYQAVLRNASGQVMANQEVEIGVAILQGSDTGTEVFAETHSVTTNSFGLANLQIGSVNTSEMQTIDWSAGPYFIQISVDGTVMGASQLLSVPFAMHAVTVENDAVDDDDADPENEIQVLSINADTIYLSSGGFVVLPPEADPAFTNWDKSSGIAISESQISDLKHFSGDSITGNETAFDSWDKNADDDFTTNDETDPVFSNSVAAAITAADTAMWAKDNDAQNELQNLSLENKLLSISNGNTIDLSEALTIDSNANKELQDISLNGTLLSISKGSTVDLADLQDGDDQRLSLGVSNQHEIRLNISNANYVEMPFVKDGVSKYNWSEAENYVAKWGQYGVMEESTIFDNGNIGIGTETPGAKLEVAGQVKITGGEPGADKILVSDADGLASWKPYIDVDTANVYNTSVVLNGTDLEVTDGGGTLIADLSSLADSGKWEIAGNNIHNSNSGNVGIGIATPAYNLTVSNPVSPTIAIGHSGAFNYAESGRLIFAEDVSYAGSCGIEFNHNGAENNLYLIGDCGAPDTIAVFNREGYSHFNKMRVGEITRGYLTNPFSVLGNSDFTGNVTIDGDLTVTGNLSYSETDPVYKSGSLLLKTAANEWNSSIAKTIDAADTTRWGLDSDSTNELQSLSISNDTIYLSDGGNVKLPAASPVSATISTFGYVYELATVADATVVGGADVPFSNNGPLSGVTHTAGITTITVPTTGTYKIDYSLNFTAGVGAAMAIAINGVVDASTSVPLLVSTGHISGSVLLTLTAGDVITLRNNSATALTMTLATNIGAQLNVTFYN